MNFGVFVNSTARKMQATRAKRPAACYSVFSLAQFEKRELSENPIFFFFT